jgi:NADPH2:quinone reductase
VAIAEDTLQIIQSLGPLTGKNLVIVGAAGGVGSFATQLAAQAGAHVIAVDRGDSAKRLHAYGAAEADLVRAGGTALTTKYVGDLVAQGRLEIPPITAITLEELPALNATTRANGTTVITI